MTDDELRAVAKRYRAYQAIPAHGRTVRDHNQAAYDAADMADAMLVWEDRFSVSAELPPLCRVPESTAFAVGDPVRKVGGDYTLDGHVRGVVVKASGAVRYAVEDARGILMIYSAHNLEART